MPLDVDNGGPGPFLEGGDVLVYGRHVFVGNSGRASTALGVEWLRKLIAPQAIQSKWCGSNRIFFIWTAPWGSCARACSWCTKRDSHGIPQVLEDWTRIPVTMEEAMTLGTNGLPISPEVYVTDPAFRRIGDAVQKHGVTVEYVEFDNLPQFRRSLPLQHPNPSARVSAHSQRWARHDRCAVRLDGLRLVAIRFLRPPVWYGGIGVKRRRMFNAFTPDVVELVVLSS